MDANKIEVLDANSPLVILSKSRPLLLAFKILLLPFTGLLTVVFFDAGVTVKWMFLTLFGCSIASIICRWGWVVPCAAAGIIIGTFSDAVVKGGDAESQMWETIVRLVFGTGGGVVMGFFLERLRTVVTSHEVTNDGKSG